MIKLIACILMVIDHVGAIFFPNCTFGLILRLIGRLCMPLFAYAIATGVYHTKSWSRRTKYIGYLLIFTIVSQYPYYLMGQHTGAPFMLNIGATWFIAVLILTCVEQILKELNNFTKGRWLLYSASTLAAISSIIGLLIFIAIKAPVEYTWYGVIYPLIFYGFIVAKNERKEKQTKEWQKTWMYNIMLNVGYGALTFNFLQPLAMLALPLIQIKGNHKILPKWFFYVFYPGHILLLLGMYHLIHQ